MGAPFFANQKLDEVGLVGIQLQKFLIFFIILDALWLVFGFSFFGAVMSLLFHVLVLRGVYKRRTCVLLMYGIFNVLAFIMTAIIILVVVVAVAMMPASDYGYSSSEASTSTSTPMAVDLVSSIRGHFSAHARGLLESPLISSSSSSENYYSSSDSEYINGNGVLLIALITLLFSFFVLYAKIRSTVLAFRMRKMLLAQTNPEAPGYMPVSTTEPINEEIPSTYYEPAGSNPYEQTHPIFSHPGFIPFQPSMMNPAFFPSAQGYPNAMMPPPFMYGQHPVFYTYSPTAQQTPDNIEKL